MYTNRSISPYFPQVIFIKQKNPKPYREKKNPEKQTKNQTKMP